LKNYDDDDELKALRVVFDVTMMILRVSSETEIDQSLALGSYPLFCEFSIDKIGDISLYSIQEPQYRHICQDK
jgi:hypothetical protein